MTDGEATGTIKNSDPLPRALLARFGRTAAVHVVEHVEERLAAPREPGFRGRFAGRELRRGMEREMALSFLSQLGASAGAHPLGGSAAGGMGSLGTPGRAAGTPMAAAGGPMGAVSGLGATAGPLGGAVCQSLLANLQPLRLINAEISVGFPPLVVHISAAPF